MAVITNDFVTTGEDVPVYRAAAQGVLANDDPQGNGPLEVDPDSAVATTGDIAFQPDGSFVYVPGTNFSGTDTITYEMKDSLDNHYFGQLTINVTATATEPELRMADATLTGVVPVGPEQVFDLSGVEQDQLFLAPQGLIALANGGYVVGIEIRPHFPTDTHFLEMQVYGADGLPAGATITLDHQDDFNYALQMVPLADGFATFWNYDAADPGQANKLQFFDNAGAPVAGPIDVGNASSVHGVSALVKLSNGNFAARWVDDTDGTIVQIFDRDGNPVGGQTVLPHPSLTLKLSALTADTDGGFIVGWVATAGGNETISAQRYNADGSLNGGEILVRAAEPPGGIPGPAITGLANGGFAMAWTEAVAPQGSIRAIHSVTIGPDNLPASGEIVSHDTFIGSLFGILSPRVTELTNGYVVTWEDGREPWRVDSLSSAGPRPGRFALLAQVFDNDGHALSGVIVVRVIESQTEFGAVRATRAPIALPDGGFVIGAQDFQSGVSDLNAVALVFDSHGNRVGNQAPLEVDPALIQLTPTLALLADGELVGAWLSGDPIGSTGGFVSQRLDLTTSIAVPQDGGPLVVPLTIETNDIDNSESPTRVVIAGLPDGTLVTPPAGMTATFNHATQQWTLTGTIPSTFSLTVKLPLGFSGKVEMLATVFAKDADGTTETPSDKLALPITVALSHGETIIGTAGDDFVNAHHTVPGQPLPTPLADRIFGRGGHDTLYGLAGNDRMQGGRGGDQIFGGAGNDLLFGGPGDDFLFGGPGKDRLNGGTGHNLLNGGVGADRFVFTTRQGDSHVADFSHHVDKLVFAKSVFKSLDKVSYDASTGALLFDADGPGGAAPVKFGSLAAHLPVDHSDFLLV